MFANTPSDTDLAYLAGVVDSDGYITITCSERNGVVYHGARVGITGTRPLPHEMASGLWGGRVARYVPRNPNHRPFYMWSRDGRSAVPVLHALRPFLRIKRANADLALELHEHVLSGRGDDPFPWFVPDYDPLPARYAMRSEMVSILNQGVPA